MTLSFTPLDPRDAADVGAWVAILAGAWGASLTGFPTIPPASARLEFLQPATYVEVVHLLAKKEGRVVGGARMALPMRDNLHNVWVAVGVDPRHWGQGIGSRVMSEVEEFARQRGRGTATGFVGAEMNEAVPTDPRARRLAQRHGFDVVSSQVHNRTDLGDPRATDEALLRRCWGRAGDYELVQWSRRAPDDVVDGIAYLQGRLNLDAPAGETDVEAEEYDAARIRDNERARHEAGEIVPATVVRQRETRRVAGFSAVEIQPGMEENCWQGITLVDPRDRGHGLGTILKLENHRHVLRHRPQMRFVHTFNDDANSHMLRINEMAGYVPRERWLVVQKKLE